MILFNKFIFIVAMALPSFNRHLSSILFSRVAAIILIFSGAFILNAFYIQSIGSGIGVFSGLFQINTISQQLDKFLLIIGALILKLDVFNLIDPINLITDINSYLFFSPLIFSRKNTILSKTGLINIKYFHSSFILLSDSELEKRIKNLNSNEKEKLENINLTEDELKKISDISELTSASDSSDNETLPSSSSFEECFPNFKSTYISEDLKILLVKIFQSKDPKFQKIFEELGYNDGIIYIINNYKVSSEVLLNDSFKALQEENKIMKNTLEGLKKEIEAIKSDNIDAQWLIEKSKQLSATLDRLGDLGMSTMKTYLNNKNLIDLGFVAASVISPLLAYRIALNSYVRVMDPYINKNVNLKPEDIVLKTARRQMLVKNFNIVAIPLIVGYSVLGLYSVKKFQFDVTVKKDSDINNNFTNNPNPGASVLGFLSIKSYIRSPFFIFSLFLFTLNFFILPYVKNHYPLLYTGILEHFFNNYNYYFLSLLSWPLIITFYNIIELYFYTYHCNSSIELNLPKYLPKFLKNTYSKLYTLSKSDEKLVYTIILFNNVIFSLVLSLISFCAVYFFL